jgi:hypothetical protein
MTPFNFSDAINWHEEEEPTIKKNAISPNARALFIRISSNKFKLRKNNAADIIGQWSSTAYVIKLMMTCE